MQSQGFISYSRDPCRGPPNSLAMSALFWKPARNSNWMYSIWGFPYSSSLTPSGMPALAHRPVYLDMSLSSLQNGASAQI